MTVTLPRRSTPDPSASAPVQRRRPGGMLASFSVLNYRWFFAGAITSNIGTWMAVVAQDWLVLTQLTDHSSAALGLVTGLQFAPMALLAPITGAVADRFSKRTLLIIAQLLLCLNALVLFGLTATGVVELWHVFLLATLQGVFSAFENPARQAFVSEMVPNQLLTNAIGLNSASFNGARLLGPGLAGLLIGAFGIAPALLVNAISFLAVIGSLVAMRTDELTPAVPRTGKGAVREGLAYVKGRPDIMLLMAIVFMLGTFGMNFQVTNALMATTVFHKGAEEYGLLGSIMAVGTFGAALVAARRRTPSLRVLLLALGGFSLGTLALALAPSYLLYSVLLVPVGLFSLTVLTSANAAVQLSTPAPLRGRVMALYIAIFLGGTPVGAPVIGWIGELFGARATLLVGAILPGLTCVAAVWLLYRRPALRLQPAV